MRVLVTGGCGFLGTHVCQKFSTAGWEVVSVDNLTKFELSRTGYDAAAARKHNLDFLKSLNIHNIEGDIRHPDFLLDHASGADLIIHTAAQPAMTIGLEQPLYDLETNIVGTINSLEASKRHKIPLANCATIHVYGNKINENLTEHGSRYHYTGGAITEETPLLQGNITPLHISKAAAEQYLVSYVLNHGIKAASFRLTGIYGPRQFGGEDHGWVANFAIRNISGRDINIYGNGKQVRDILYAEDAAEAFFQFSKNPISGIFNIGGGPETSISLLETVRLIETVTGTKSKLNFHPSRNGDLQFFVCDSTKAENTFQWRATTKPPLGVTRLIHWIEKNREIFV